MKRAVLAVLLTVLLCAPASALNLLNVTVTTAVTGVTTAALQIQGVSGDRSLPVTMTIQCRLTYGSVARRRPCGCRPVSKSGNFVGGSVAMCLESDHQYCDAGAEWHLGTQTVPLVVQQINPLRVTHCRENPLTHITPPLC